MIGGGQLPDFSLSCIFNALLIGGQYKSSHFNKLILGFSKVIGKIFIKDRSVTVESITFKTCLV